MAEESVLRADYRCWVRHGESVGRVRVTIGGMICSLLHSSEDQVAAETARCLLPLAAKMTSAYAAMSNASTSATAGSAGVAK